jgi:hypothetical protein
MKIKSDFIDYYDNIQLKVLSSEPTIVFLRKEHFADVVSSIKVKEILKDYLDTIKSFEVENGKIELFLVGFCGALYSGAYIKGENGEDVSYTLTGTLYMPKDFGFNVTTNIEQASRKHFHHKENISLEPFQILNTPFFVLYPNDNNVIDVIINTNLNNLKFYKAHGSYHTYHTIKNFLLTSMGP